MYFKNGTVLRGDQFQEGMSFTIGGGEIIALSPAENMTKQESGTMIDLQGRYVVPGLIDLQLYGTEGFFFGGEPTVENLRGMEDHLLRQGVTRFLATVATNVDDVVLEAIHAAKEFRRESRGAFMGLHLEGPFLNPEKRGAHPRKLIRKGTVEEAKKWIDLAEGEIKMMTVAPEWQEKALLDYLKGEGIVLSVGHSNATYEEAYLFLNETVKTATHLFNAMPLLHHRHPGLVAAIFQQQTYASIIADGIHVSYPMIRLAKRELGCRLFLITDAVASATTGIYPHQRKENYYTTPDGILSGSSLELLDAVKNCVEHAGIAVGEAFAMATEYPAKVMGWEGHRGTFTVGDPADFLILDHDFNLLQVWFKGERITG